MNLKGNSLCQYQDERGHCRRHAEGIWCFWHDESTDKTGPEIKPQLEKMAQEGESLRGFKLRNANLKGIRLVAINNKPFDLGNADLSHANLTEAHLYRINLKNACLFKAHFTHASMNRADVTNANLLGASFDHAKTEHVTWGKCLYQAQLALTSNDAKQVKHFYEEAEEVCKVLHRHCEKQELREEASQFLYQQLCYHRKQFSIFSLTRWVSKLFDLVCGYGEKPLRILGFALFYVCVFGYIFYATSTLQGEGLIGWHSSHSLIERLEALANAVYFSAVTFTTLGYGDISPIGIGRFLAVLEAFLGQFSIALFVVVFVRRMTR